MIIEFGAIEFTGANSANVPVNISISLIDDDVADTWPELAKYKGWWMVDASNYMPRKGGVSGNAYLTASESRGELVAYIQQHTRPLYQAALARIDNLDQTDEDGYSSLYYWEKNHE